jgi:hypothetical protein
MTFSYKAQYVFFGILDIVSKSDLVADVFVSLPIHHLFES